MGRILGWLFVLLGACFAGADLVFPPPGGFALRALGQWWFFIHPDSLQLVQPAIERHVAPFLWDPVILSILQAPAAVLFAGLGACLLLLAARRAG
jgi:hypothetical protein